MEQGTPVSPSNTEGSFRISDGFRDYAELEFRAP